MLQDFLQNANMHHVIGQKGQTCNHGHLGGGNGRLFINLGCTMGVPLQHSRGVFFLNT